MVFRIQGSPDGVAKIYHPSHKPDRHKTAKLAAMVQSRTDQLSKLTAWPTDLLHDGSGGPVVGFLMPLLTGCKEMHLLYTPKTRLAEFPEASWQFLVHTAMNTAIAFHTVHNAGQIIGDVNHGNIFVSQDATVRLIDCDSFQIARQAELYLCEVGVPTHTPPELQGKSFKVVRRTVNHDLFGLAVAIFQLLFLGRHPFSGIHLGKGEPPTLENAISAFKFAYGRAAGSQLIQPPPGGLGLGQVTPTIGSLFERAFSPAGASEHGRPSADEWAAALKAQLGELKACSANPGHVFLRSNATCPWCTFEIAAGRAIFNFVLKPGAHQAVFDVDALAAEIAAVALPARQSVPKTVKTCHPEPDYARAGAGSWRRVTIALAIGLAVCALGLLPALRSYELGLMPLAIFLSLFIGTRGARNTLRYKAKAALSEARREIVNLTALWDAQTGAEHFDTMRTHLDKLVVQYRHLPKKRLDQLRELERRREETQRRQFLDQHELKNATIKGVGDSRKAALLSFNIETAFDITLAALHPVPGFGPVLIDSMIEWRRSVERRFRFNPTLQVDPVETNRIEQGILSERQRIAAELKTGLDALRQQPMIAEGRYDALTKRLAFQAEVEAQAVANIAACG